MKNETGLTGFLHNKPDRLNKLFTIYALRLTKLGCGRVYLETWNSELET